MPADDDLPRSRPRGRLLYGQWGKRPALFIDVLAQPVQPVLRLTAVLVSACVVACFVHRPSEDFECASQSDCTNPRVCQNGFCVAQNCPSDCTSCNEAARTCQVDCTSANQCGSIDCPSGWSCTINCTGGNACQDIVCRTDSKCRVTCNGTDACETLYCGNACACDQSCTPADACNAPTCPSFGNGTNQVDCTSDGATGSPCESAHAAGCTKC